MKLVILASILLSSLSAFAISGDYILEQNDCFKTKIPEGSRVSVSAGIKDVLISAKNSSQSEIIDHFYVGTKKVTLNFGARLYIGSFSNDGSSFHQQEYLTSATDPDRLVETVEISKTSSSLVILRVGIDAKNLFCVLRTI